MGTKKNELFGKFARGGYSSTISFKDHFAEEIRIRKDNGQSYLTLGIIILYKSIKILEDYLLNENNKLMNKKKYLITGVAGFIGFNFAKFLLLKGCNVYGIDNLDHYYSVKLKKKRLNELKKFKNFKFYRFNIEINNEFNKLKIRNLDYIYHFVLKLELDIQS